MHIHNSNAVAVAVAVSMGIGLLAELLVAQARAGSGIFNWVFVKSGRCIFRMFKTSWLLQKWEVRSSLGTAQRALLVLELQKLSGKRASDVMHTPGQAGRSKPAHGVMYGLYHMSDLLLG